MTGVQAEMAVFTGVRGLAAGVCRDSGQAEPKMVAFENRSGADIESVSTGSAESHRLQAGIT
ncbi:hypothetical protein CK230_04955 [Mesorhizobium sp. WSM3859]|nr:hypothetical protein CK230_04955 [Mesorhizobium sp. WSM3859]